MPVVAFPIGRRKARAVQQAFMSTWRRLPHSRLVWRVPWVVCAVVCAALALFVPGCRKVSARDSASWIQLAQGFHAQPVADGEPWLPVHPGEPPVLLRPDAEGGPGVWVESSLERSAWSATAWAGVWTAPARLHGVDQPRDGSAPHRLRAAGLETHYIPLDSSLLPTESPPLDLSSTLRPESSPRGSFSVVSGQIFLVLAPGEEPPAEAHSSVYVRRGWDEAGTWRVHVGRFAADGLSVWPGRREVIHCSIPPGSMLRFGTAAQARIVPGAPDGTVDFRVALDGEPLLEHHQQVSDVAGCEWHELRLPVEGRQNATLSFEVAGGMAISAFLTPTIGPAEIGGYGQRPWEPYRPDIVLFVADTFRADILNSTGSGPEVAPELARFARESKSFPRTWSTSSWTLPACASMFSGLYPPQHGAVKSSLALPEEIETLVERLAQHGYRTGAVTDSGFVSQRYGLDQGFELFEEHWGDLDATLARAREFLDRDDGRPVFLLVHTYRTHVPYRASTATRERLRPWLPIEGEWEDAYAKLQSRAFAWTRAEPVRAELLAAVEAVRRLYLGGAADLDRGFGEFRADLERRGLFDAGYLVFSSDHGEMFGEQQAQPRSGAVRDLELFHGKSVWDAVARVPLLIHGPGLAPEVSTQPASLVDLPRSLGELARIAPEPTWLGRSVLSSTTPKPILLFDCSAMGEPRTAIVQWPLKLVFRAGAEEFAATEIEGAYDLEVDPAEQHRLDPSALTLRPEALRQLCAEAVSMLEARTAGRAAHLGAEDQRLLRNLGYAGGETEHMSSPRAVPVAPDR
jgi:arylsulfatase A-like enzyme